ncbi:hypothetical protein HPB48_010792 [Haemaphysalis longicornis]|uniref:Peptidase M13 N-terminal domain-containing protein n=1 Tax=Haemaphysalis longicornis TaxID=44386 RepID=A0A9J6H242_HAELO|nr:hypothetical protein HPB48_010792 [Haemaphysalis longicornis]
MSSFKVAAVITGGMITRCLVAAVVVFAAFVILALLLVEPETDQKPANTVCRTSSCLRYSYELRQSLNESLDPCESFTSFVCDGWRRANSLSVLQAAFQRHLDTMAYLASTFPVTPRGQNVTQRAAVFYRSCDAVARGERDELPAVKEALLEANVLWPKRQRDADLFHLLVYLSLRLHWNVIFRVQVTLQEDTVSVTLTSQEEFRRLARKFETFESKDERKAYFEVIWDAFREG